MEDTLLQIAILVPLLASLFLLAGGINGAFAKAVAWLGFAMPFAITLWLSYDFYQSAVLPGEYMYVSKFGTGLEFIGVNLHLGVNAISMPLVLLAGIVGMAAGIYAIYSNAERLSLYLGLLLMMQAGLLGTFASIDIFFFYFFHELALIPTFIMIGIWGGQGRRMK